jgi:hypothetical protein
MVVLYIFQDALTAEENTKALKQRMQLPPGSVPHTHASSSSKMSTPPDSPIIALVHSSSEDMPANVGHTLKEKLVKILGTHQVRVPSTLVC